MVLIIIGNKKSHKRLCLVNTEAKVKYQLVKNAQISSVVRDDSLLWYNCCKFYNFGLFLLRLFLANDIKFQDNTPSMT